VFRPSERVRGIALWEYDGTSYVSVPANGTISGIVTENSVILPFCDVLLYFRNTGALINRTKTNALGQFVFYDLDPTPPSNPDFGKYFVVALDPHGGNRYNAQIYDRVVAV
jgi:hypothetical protein